MTTTEHLARIRARCVELLELANKRTPGKWIPCKKGDYIPVGGLEMACVLGGDIKAAEAYEDEDSSFIASCAGPAEAGWRATIHAIDAAEEFDGWEGRRMRETIIAAWPEELL